MGRRVATGVGMAILVAVSACGGKSQQPVVEQEAGPPQALASWSYVGVDGPVAGGTSLLVDQCLGNPLPLGADGEPDCVFIRAVYAHGTAAPDAVAACAACNAPGEAPVPASVPLASFTAGIDGYDCLCLVEAQPPAAPCPPAGGFVSSSPAAWCYTDHEPNCPSEGATRAIEFSPAASLGSVLYGACFIPGTIAVTYAP